MCIRSITNTYICIKVPHHLNSLNVIGVEIQYMWDRYCLISCDMV